MEQPNESCDIWQNRCLGVPVRWPDDFDITIEVQEVYMLYNERFMDKEGRMILCKGDRGLIFPWQGVMVKIHTSPAYFEVLEIRDGYLFKYQPRMSNSRGGGWEKLGPSGPDPFDFWDDFSYTEDVRLHIQAMYGRVWTNNGFSHRSFPRDILPDIQYYMRDPLAYDLVKGCKMYL